MRWKILGILVFAIIIALFTLLNAEPVTVHFGVATLSVQLIIVLLVSLLLGMALMTVFWAAHAWKLRRSMNELKARIRELESQLSAQVETAPDEGNLPGGKEPGIQDPGTARLNGQDHRVAGNTGEDVVSHQDSSDISARS